MELEAIIKGRIIDFKDRLGFDADIIILSDSNKYLVKTLQSDPKTLLGLNIIWSEDTRFHNNPVVTHKNDPHLPDLLKVHREYEIKEQRREELEAACRKAIDDFRQRHGFDANSLLVFVDDVLILLKSGNPHFDNSSQSFLDKTVISINDLDQRAKPKAALL